MVEDLKQSVASAVVSKLEDGNIRAAIRILCSNDRPVSADLDTLTELRTKHPSPPIDRPRITAKNTVAPFQTTEYEVLGRIRSFPQDSSGGPDGLRPQHLSDLVNCTEVGSELISAITGLVNLLLKGECPEFISPILFGGTLMALRKASGGLRPIVIGYCWRRLASKCANTYAVSTATAYLAPRQVGVGVPGGAEAAVHSARCFLEAMPTGSILVKLDFKNAFNSLFRDRMLSSIDDVLPELAPFCHLAYAEPSQLLVGHYNILSQVGPQQVDPLGPLLFCLPLQPILQDLSSPLVLGYMDDVSLGGEAAIVAEDVKLLKQRCEQLGLQLNQEKCEIVYHNDLQYSDSVFHNFTVTTPERVCLLGAPLSTSEALSNCLEDRCTELELAISRLEFIAKHDALTLLRFSLSSQRLVYTLRCSPCTGHVLLDRIDAILRNGLSIVFNIDLSNDQWLRASLPVKMGGLGIRRVASLALPAFLASAAGTRDLQSSMLGFNNTVIDVCVEEMTRRWCDESHITPPDESVAHSHTGTDRLSSR